MHDVSGTSTTQVNTAPPAQAGFDTLINTAPAGQPQAVLASWDPDVPEGGYGRSGRPLTAVENMILLDAEKKELALENQKKYEQAQIDKKAAYIIDLKTPLLDNTMHPPIDAIKTCLPHGSQ